MSGLAKSKKEAKRTTLLISNTEEIVGGGQIGQNYCTIEIGYSDIGYSDSFRMVPISLHLKLLDVVTNIGYSDKGFDEIYILF